MAKYDVEWINPEAEQGPLFRIGRDVYERERPGSRLIWLRAHESYPHSVADRTARAFEACAERWQAPVVFVIDPNLKKPPAARFLFEWSRSTFASGAVDQSYMVTTNLVTQVMGKVVLRMFTDGAMPFRAVQGHDALNAHLDTLELSCGWEDFELKETRALVLRGEAPPTLMQSLMKRVRRRLTGR